MKKIKCLSMVIVALGFFAFSANAQNIKEVRKQGLSQKLKAHKTLEATPQLPEQTAPAGTTELKVKPSANTVKLKPRPNATKKEIKTVTVQRKSSIKAMEKRPVQNFKVDREKRAAKLSQRMSNRQFDMDAAKQKIKKRGSNQ